MRDPAMRYEDGLRPLPLCLARLNEINEVAVLSAEQTIDIKYLEIHLLGLVPRRKTESNRAQTWSAKSVWFCVVLFAFRFPLSSCCSLLSPLSVRNPKFLSQSSFVKSGGDRAKKDQTPAHCSTNKP